MTSAEIKIYAFFIPYHTVEGSALKVRDGAHCPCCRGHLCCVAELMAFKALRSCTFNEGCLAQERPPCPELGQSAMHSSHTSSNQQCTARTRHLTSNAHLTQESTCRTGDSFTYFLGTPISLHGFTPCRLPFPKQPRQTPRHRKTPHHLSLRQPLLVHIVCIPNSPQPYLRNLLRRRSSLQ
jgi:hypothetical protein